MSAANGTNGTNGTHGTNGTAALTPDLERFRIEQARSLAAQRPIAGHYDVFAATEADDTNVQVRTGLAEIVYRDPATFLRWPWPALADVAGGIAPGQVHFLVAFSGIGKTTFMTSAIDRWAELGTKVFVLSLEAKPEEFRARWACFRANVHPGDLLAGKMAADDPRRAEIARQYKAQAADPFMHCVRVKGTARIDVMGMRDACIEATDWGADVVVIDHIDHMASSDASLHQQSVELTQATYDFARELELRIIATSQCNNALVTGGDKLAKYQPPQEHHVKYGGHKREVCTTMLSLFRPIRGRATDEAPVHSERGSLDRERDPYLKAIAAARRGDAPPATVLESGVQGVALMKDRNYGRDGTTVRLGYVSGRIVDEPPEIRLEREAREHGIRTGRPL